MTQFIEVTRTDDEKMFATINVDKIESVFFDRRSNETKICFNEHSYLPVKESYEYIKKILMGKIVARHFGNDFSLINKTEPHKALPALTAVARSAKAYKEYLPNVEPSGAAKYSAMNKAAWNLRKSLSELEAIDE